MTGPALYSPDNPFAPKPDAGTPGYSPDNPFAPKSSGRILKPLRTPMAPRDVTATAQDATATGLEQQARARTLPGQLEAAPGQVAEIAGQALQHPLKTIAGMARAVVEAPYLTGRYVGQQVLPGGVEDVSGKEALGGAAMLAAPAISAIAGPMAAATATGAAFMPDQPIAGGIIGAAVHVGARGRFRERTGPEAPMPPEPLPTERRLAPGPSPIRATMAPEARSRAAEPDYTVTVNEAAPEVPARALTAPQAPKLLPRLRRVAPEEPAAPVRPRAPESPASWLPDDEPVAPKPINARTASGRLMSNLKKATDDQLAGEYRAMLDAFEADQGTAQGSVRIFGSLDYADDPSSGGHLGDVGVVSTNAGMKASGRNQQRMKSIEKLEAELARRGIDKADAYWMASGESAPGAVGEKRPPYGGVTPEQRAKFDALYQRVRPEPSAAERMLEVGKRRAAELEKPAGAPDLAPALEREGTVGERKRPYLKTAPSLFAPDNPSMFEGPANMDETSVGKRPTAPAEPEAPKVRNAAELTAGEDQRSLFERGPKYGTDEKLTGVAFRAKDGGKVYSMEGFDGGHSELFDRLESEGVPTVDVPGEGRFERAFATFDHGFVTSSGRFVTREEGLAIARKQHQLDRQARVTGGFGLAAENIRGARVSERQAQYGAKTSKFMKRRLQQRAAEEGIDVRAEGMDETSTLPSDPEVKMGLLTDANLEEMNRAWWRDMMNPDHPAEYKALLEADRAALDAEIARRLKPGKVGTVREAPARYALQAAGDEGFPARLYSRVARAIDSAPFEKGTADQWKAHLSKNVPASEREYSGLDRFLAEHSKGSLTREEVANAFNAGRIILTETTLGGTPRAEVVDARTASLRRTSAFVLARQIEAVAGEGYGVRKVDAILDDLRNFPNLTPQQILFDHSLPARPGLIQTMENYRQAASTVGANPPTRFGGWTEAGGTNYREHVLSLKRPRRAGKYAIEENEDGSAAVVDLASQRVVHRATTLAEAQDWAADNTPAGAQTVSDVFHSEHWPGIDNPLVHVRTADHVLSNGEQVLLVEEIQSDWHQKGRKLGYKRPGFNRYEMDKQIDALNAEMSRLAALMEEKKVSTPQGLAASRAYTETMEKRNELSRQYRDAAGSMPDAPLKKTEQWAELGLKKAVDEAVQGGYDRVVIVDGETSAVRYDLSKHVDTLRYDPATESLTALKNDQIVHQGRYDARALADVVGKDVADRLLAVPLIDGAEELAKIALEREDLAEQLAEMRTAHPEDMAAHERMMEARGAALDIIEANDRFGFDTVAEAGSALRTHDDWANRWGLDLTEAERQTLSTYRAASKEHVALEAKRVHREAPLQEKLTKLNVRAGRLKQGAGTHQLSGAGLKVGGAGMKTFYDKIIPGVARDYFKSLGVKVALEPVKMGKSEMGFAEIADAAENMGARGRFEDRANVLAEIADRMEETGASWREAFDFLEQDGRSSYPITEIVGAREWLERAERERGHRSQKTFLSFKVTPELRAKVLEGGQRVAERAVDARQIDAFGPEQIDAFDAPKPVAARAVEKFGSEDKAARAIALVEQHAGKFATTYNGPAPTGAERLAKVGKRNRGGSMVDIVGKVINTPRDLAKALYPFRSPLHERFFTVVHGEDGAVLSVTMDTSGAINYVAPYGGGESGAQRFVQEIIARVRRTGGKEVTIAHNHPSGTVTQSADDRSYWMWIGWQLQKAGIHLRGQLVIDHDDASWLGLDKVTGSTETTLSVPSGGPDWVNLRAPTMDSPDAIAELVGPGANNGGLHVVYVDGQLRVIAVEPHNPSALKTMGVWLPAHAKGFGAAEVMLVGPEETALDILAAVRNAEMEIRVRDIATAVPQPDGSVRFQSEVQRGRINGSTGILTERTEALEAGKFRRLSEAPTRYGEGGGRPGKAGTPGPLRALHGVAEAGAPYGRSEGYKKARAAGIASGLTPEQADAYAAAAKDIDFDGAKAVALAKEQAGGLRTRLRRWADAAADQTRAIDRLSRAAVARGMPMDKAPEYELALSYNSDDTIRRALYDAPEMATTHGILDPINREPMGPTLESVVKPLGHNPEKVRQAFTYVVALRKVGRGLRATAGDANELQASIDAVDALGKIPMYRQFARDLEAHLDGIGRYAVRSGLWTEQQWEQLKHSDLFYIPFRRLMTHIEAKPGTKTYGTKRANLSAGIERFEGSRRFLMNPVEAVAGYDSRIIRRADAYRVGSSVIDALTQYMGEEGAAILTPLASNDPAVKAFTAAAMRRNLAQSGLNIAEMGMVADLSEPQIDPHNPVIWRHRKGGLPPTPKRQIDAFGEALEEQPTDREYFLLNEPELYKALVATRADSPLGTGALMTAFRVARRIMTVTTTGINPRFALGLNIARDVPQAMMQNAGIRPDDIAAGALEALKAVVGHSEFADLMARHGLGNASIYAHAVNAEAVARRLAPVTKVQRLTSKAGAVAKWPLEFAERVGAASDLVARLAAARADRRNAMKAGETPRAAAARAATTGIRATVNFNRRAGTPLLQFLEQSVPFFGAAIRSVVRFGEAGVEVPGRVAGAIAVVTLAVLAEWAMTRDDKEKRAQQVDRLPSERSRFIQFGKYRWPLSQEMAVIAAGVRVALAQFTKDDPDNAEQLVQAIYNLMPPVASDLAQGDVIAPWPGWREVQEVARNEQAYGNRPIVPERLMRKPPALRRFENTAPTFDVLAQAARKGALIVPSLAETSPLAVEHVVRGFFQNMTPLVTAISDAALRRTAMGRSLDVPVPLPLSQAPLMPSSAFVVRTPPGRTASEAWFYARRREFEEGMAGEKVVSKMEQTAETPAGMARAEGMRARAGALPWALSEDRAVDVRIVFKEAENRLDQYEQSQSEIRQQVNDGLVTPRGARLLLDSLATERQHMLRETRAVLEKLGVPAQTRPQR